VRQHLVRRGLTLAVAESCTGGLLQARLTELPGASAVLQGGVVPYANAAKSELLGVPEALLQAHGAVSEPVALAMAQGVRRRFLASVGIATTGIAGPAGGSADKPVGTVCFAVVSPAGERAWTVRIPDLGRAFIRDRAVFELWRALLTL
jgi:PncC family amidohydrolase